VQIFNMVGGLLARYLEGPSKGEVPVSTCTPEQLKATLRKGDVLLVEGSSRFSTAVKYLTQSTWSHASLYVADGLETQNHDTEGEELLEADVIEGVRRVPLSMYWNLHTRICRPVGITAEEIDQVVAYAISRIGHQYDLKNVIDLARYLIQTPPVPTHWRRRMLALGSGDPTRAICSSLVAQAFQSIQYPILPESVVEKSKNSSCRDCYREYLHIRHHSLFTPRDFDISPYFQVVKPTLENEFDPHNLAWIGENKQDSV